jgi:hypothetical protein
VSDVQEELLICGILILRLGRLITVCVGMQSRTVCPLSSIRLTWIHLTNLMLCSVALEITLLIVLVFNLTADLKMLLIMFWMKMCLVQLILVPVMQLVALMP